ncbi:hypothetical protein FBUS_02524 [Fasciolopsis buskii]|uniref:Uncharacterized protein n=1 Tax=Fasciolopsis buskii TaxID=27845 RepID=A0A8E0S0Q0_9TREM|nr:hypothetical protein FBUS_02524 [Fasciolopsis buski]
MEEAFPNLMNDDTESYVDEEILSEEDLVTTLQADVSDEWESSSQERQTKRKTNRMVSTLMRSRRSLMQKSISSSLYSLADPSALIQKIRVSDAQSVNPELQTAEGRAFVRRLIGLLAADCAPKSIYRKYVQEHQIRFDFSDLSQHYQYGYVSVRLTLFYQDVSGC